MKLLSALAALLLAAPLAAQTTTITSTHERLGGADITEGTVLFTGVGANGLAVVFADATGAQNGPDPFACHITNGAIDGAIGTDGTVSGTCALPDAGLTTPGINYSAQVCDTSVGLRTSGHCFTVLLAGVTGPSFQLDHAAPLQTVPLVQSLTYTTSASAPIGACAGPAEWLQTSPAKVWFCVNGLWVSPAGGGGNGVSSATATNPGVMELAYSPLSNTTAENYASKGRPGGYAPLDNNGLIPSNILPATGTTPAATSSTPGTVELATNGSSNTTAENAANRGIPNGYAPLDSTGKVPSANLPASTGGGSSTFAALTDAPTANAQLAAALNAKVSTSQVGAASGVAPLDSNGKVPSANLPASTGGTGTPSTPSPQAAFTSARYYALTNAAYNKEAFSDSSGSYWAAGGAFLSSGVFADDLALAVIAAPDAFDAPDLENIIGKFEAAANGAGEMPVGIAANGTAVTFWSSDDQKHNHASGDAQLMLPQLQFQSYLMSGSTAGISAHIAGLAAALNTVQTDGTGLCVVNANDRWMPWLFEETAQHTGHVTVCSLFLARDYQVMAQMYTAIGNGSAASTWASKYSTIMASLSGTGSPLWNSSTGMYRMDDGALASNVDVDGSALACYFGFATTAQCTAISNWLVTNLSTINRGGFLRQSNSEFAACGGISSAGAPVDNTGGLCAGGVYQSGGVWGVQLGWALYTIGLTSPATAQSLLAQALVGPGSNPRIEWYAWTGTAAGSDYNLESTMGFYDYARKGYSVPTAAGAAASSASAYPAEQQIGTSPLYLWDNNGGVSATTVPGSPNTYTGFVASAFGITSHNSTTPFGFIYSSTTNDGLVHFGDGTNDTFTFNPSTKVVNFVNPPTGVNGGSSSIAYGTPSLDGTSPSGGSVVNNPDWPTPTDQYFVLVITPTSSVAAGSAAFVLNFGKEWTNASRSAVTNPLCQFGMAGNGIAEGVNWGLSGVGFKQISIAPTAPLQAGHTYIALGTCNAPSQVAAGTY